MGEIMSIIQEIQTDKNTFTKLAVKMEPLIKKYVRLLYKDEKEDVRSEMMLALWEAVIKMEYCEKEGECIAYLCTALKNRFFELYRKSKKEHDHLLPIEDDDVLNMIGVESTEDLEDVIFNIDIELFLEEHAETRNKIFRMIILENKSDTEIAKVFYVTRQYINKLRKELYKEMLDKGFV